ncbi:MAG: hypothetical protein K2F79_03855 [Muribaculaceae bacterium]|nr:hypothetical protein [Muribaculaceae bacterium]
MNRNRSLLFAIVVAALAFFCGCRRQAQEYPPCEIVSLYNIIYDYDSLDSTARAAVLSAYEPMFESFMQVVSPEPFSPELLGWWSDSSPVRVFTPDVDSVFPSVAPLEVALGNILGRAEADSLELPARKYAAVVYGRAESMLFNDSTLFIALNHYLGSDYPGYTHWPEYMRRQKSPQRLPYDLAEALVATSYPYSASGAEATALSRMLYEGAVVYAVTRLVDNPSEALALGYGQEEMGWFSKHETELWRALVAANVVYDTAPAAASRLVDPSPAVRGFGVDAPGRAGRYIGYRIVRSYAASHPGMSLARFLSPEFYSSSGALLESGY